MHVGPFLTESEPQFTMELCMKVCRADQKCMYYHFAHKEKKCILYSYPAKECRGYLGIPKIALLECGQPSNSSQNSTGTF